MVKNSKKSEDESAASSPLAGSIKESAQQIWLAGLGAFSKAQEEGGKVFEALVKEGATLQRKTQAAAEDKLSEATGRMTSMATELSSKASGQWDKLENLFEDRVARTLKTLGVPTASDLDALVQRIDDLERTVASLRGAAARAPSRPEAAGRKVVAKRPAAGTARKRAPTRKPAE